MRRLAAAMAVWAVVVTGAACSGASGGRPETAPASGDAVAGLAEALASGRAHVIDLTQTLNAMTPIIQLPPPLANTPPLRRHEISRYDDNGPAWYWNWFEVGEHHGTHFDAPCHWVTGKDQPCVDQLDAAQFVGPAAVLDVTAEAASNPDLVVTRDMILKWEERHGRIPRGAWVILRSGWGDRAGDARAFVNVGEDGQPHYPGFGRESAEFLTTERDILGVGTEALGTDAAVGAAADPPFPNHAIMHGAGKVGLTQLANVDRLPATGAIIIAAPLKLERGSGSPVRALAIVGS